MGRRRRSGAGASTRWPLSSKRATASPDPPSVAAAELRRLVLLVGAIVLVDTMFFAAITPLLPQYADRLDLSKSAAGFLSASYAVGGLIGALPAGGPSARLGAGATGPPRPRAV